MIIQQQIQIDIWRLIWDPAMLLAVVGFFWRQAVWHGKTDRRVKDLEKARESLAQEIKACRDEQVSGTELYGRLDERLKGLEKGQDKIERTFSDQLQALQNLVREMFGHR